MSFRLLPPAIGDLDNLENWVVDLFEAEDAVTQAMNADG